MNALTGADDARTKLINKPLVDLLQRARLSKHVTGGDEPAESEAARAAYEQLGKLAGR
jgi:hypothetical protein